jgi:site-specific DNA-methyltransferase (adenine-specific)
MRVEQIGNATLYLGKMEHTLHHIHGVNHILTDPPYLYIKTHDFDREWDEKLFIENAERLLPDGGFIALFGRETSFYRWNTRLADLGFVFKEEIVWDKRYTTTPCIALSRVHETISLHAKKTGNIRRSKVPYVEQKQYNIESIVNDIKRIKSAINTESGLNRIIEFLQTGKLYKSERSIIKYNKTKWGITTSDKLLAAFAELKTLQSINGGMREKSVIGLKNDHYKLSHPTEKPVRLAERILALISDPGDIIYDPFRGSGSFGVACIRTGRKYIGSEMKPEYFDTACKRIEEAVKQNEKA